MEPFTSNSGRKGFLKNIEVTTQLWAWEACSSVVEKTHESQLNLGRQD